MDWFPSEIQIVLTFERRQMLTMRSIPGLIDDLVVLGIFIYLSLLVSGIIRMRQDRQKKWDSIMSRWGTPLRIAVYLVTLLMIFLILRMIFG